MAVQAEHLTVTDTPLALNQESNTGLTVLVKNTGLANVDLGPEDVEGGTGFTLSPGETTPALFIAADEQLYVVRSGLTNSSIEILRLGAAAT